MASCQKGPTRHAYAWQIGPFWQDTLDIWAPSTNSGKPNHHRIQNKDMWSHPHKQRVGSNYRNVLIRSALPNRSDPKWVCTSSQNSSATTKQKHRTRLIWTLTNPYTNTWFKHDMRCSRSQWQPRQPVLRMSACWNNHMSVTHDNRPMTHKMTRNRSTFHSALAPGASNRDITVWMCEYIPRKIMDIVT